MKKTLAKFDTLPFSRLHWKITLCAGGGSFLDAYILIIIGSALGDLTKDMALDAQWVGIITSAIFVGLTIGTVLFGYVADRIGRKKLFIFNIFALAACSVASALVTTPAELAAARFFMGLLIGADYPIATSMVAEFTPIKSRAWAMGAIGAIWYTGGIFAGLAGWLCFGLEESWRWLLASAVIPCLFVLWGRFSVPESPRWLIKQGRLAEAGAVFARFGLRAEGDELRTLADAAEAKTAKTRFSEIFCGANLRSLIFCSGIWICQAVPMFALFTFGPEVLARFGLAEPREAILGNVLISFAFFLGCFPAMWAITVIGRRFVCIASFAVMTAVLLGVLLGAQASVLGLAACLFVYAVASGGPGTLQWLYPNELFRTQIRATAFGCAMAITRVATIASTYFMYPMLEQYGSNFVFMAAFLISAAGLALSVRMAPETKNFSLGG